jgi:phage uncharacterized protein (putative large terminase), C-terminal domain
MFWSFPLYTLGAGPCGLSGITKRRFYALRTRWGHVSGRPFTSSSHSRTRARSLSGSGSSVGQTFPSFGIMEQAITLVTDGGGDYTVLTIWGIDSAGDVYRVDQWKGQTASDEWIEAQLDLVKKYKPLAFFGEGGVIQKAVEPMLRRRMRERNTHCRLEWLPSVADKPTRARSFQAMAATGRVHFEADADLSEFLVFPAGKHDDEVDTASLIGRAIDQAHPAIVSAKSKTQRRDGYWPSEQADNDWMCI